MNRRAAAIVTPLTTWLPTEAAVTLFRRSRLGRAPIALPPLDAAWRDVAPDFHTTLSMAASGLPFQIAADRRYDRRGNPRHLAAAVAAGKTVFLPQVHQVLPRLARLMVALRAAFFGPFREECSFMFAVEGRGRQGMGLHHDGDVDSVWLQLEGRRTVTLGPRVRPGTPEEMADAAGGPGWHTLDLTPGTLFFMPPRTPHEVVCAKRSLAVSMTWSRARKRPPGASRAEALAAWDVVSGRVDRVPVTSRRRLWTQVPVAWTAGRRAGTLRTADGDRVAVGAGARALARRLGMMASLPRGARLPGLQSLLLQHGIIAPHDLPRRIIPDNATELDGWRFA